MTVRDTIARGGSASRRSRSGHHHRRTLVVQVVGRSGDFAVSAADAGRVPHKVYWIHDARGWALGPDGSALGLWATEELEVRAIRDGRVVGGPERFCVGDLVAVTTSRVLAA